MHQNYFFTCRSNSSGIASRIIDGCLEARVLYNSEALRSAKSKKLLKQVQNFLDRLDA